MESKVPYGTQWIRDLVPDVSWDASNQNIMLPDGQVLPKSAYTIVDSKAYVSPDAVSKYLKTPTSTTTATGTGVPAGAPAGSAANVQTANAPPVGSAWIREMIPDAVWNPADKSITLPTGDVLPKNIYTVVDGKAYVNPYAIANYYAPKPITPESMQPWIDKTTQVYQPMIDRQYDRINSVIQSLQSRLDANLAGLEAQKGISERNLQQQETADGQKLRNQAIARGTYTSGVADYQQQQLAGDYAGQYQNLESGLAALIASAKADTNAQMTDLGYQASSIEDSFLSNIMNLVNSMMGKEHDSQQQQYQNVVDRGLTSLGISESALNQAITRTEMFGRVVTEADAKALGVPIGTPSYAAVADAKALSARSSGGGTGGTGGGTGGGATALDLNSMTTDQKRAFDVAMDVWETTGTAPQGILQQLGVPAGTGYNSEWQVALNEEASINQALERVTRFASGESAATIRSAAEALGLGNYNLTVALNMVEKEKDAMIAAGANIADVKALLRKSMTAPATGIGDGIKKPITPDDRFSLTKDPALNNK